MISVIVPVYNVENYLSRCIDSILNQTYTDYELILVDDGSTDNSGKICDDYAEKKSNIKVIHQKNGGLSSARNTGTDNSKGSYITFIDSDDLVSNTYLETLFELLKKYDADISCCDFSFFYDESEIVNEQNNILEKCLDGETALEEMLYGKMHGSSACAILMKRSIAETYKFPIGKFHEDDFVTFSYYGAAQKVALTSEKMYYYFQRAGSIMHRPFGQSALDQLEAADYIVEKCKNHNTNIQKASIAKKYSNYIDVFFTYQDLKNNSSETYKKVIFVLNQLKYNIIKDNNVSKRIRLSAFLLIVFGAKITLFFHNKFNI